MAELKIVFNGELSVELHDKIVAQALEMLAEVDPAAVAFYDPLPFKIGDKVRVTDKSNFWYKDEGFIFGLDLASQMPILVRLAGISMRFSEDELEKVEADDAEP
jgi:hypothetical protein